MHTGKWIVLLFLFWILLSGYFQPLLLGFGVLSVAIVLVVLKRMDAVDQEQKQVNSGYSMLRYLVWLIGQIVSSAIFVTKLIWGSADKLSPTLAKIPVTNIPKKNRVLYANSITLTPGTLSVDLVDEELTVHALQKSSIESLKQGDMEKKIIAIWGNKK